MKPRRDSQRPRRDRQGLDSIDREILAVLQQDCRMSLNKVGERVGLSAPSVMERIRKLEADGFISGYHAQLDARRLGMDVSAFIGVWVAHPRNMESLAADMAPLDDVLEVHHVTGGPTLLLKVKTRNTDSLEQLISTLRCLEGVERTETNVVLSTRVERVGVGTAALLPTASDSNPPSLAEA